MQLNEILDENTVSAISTKTNISEDNINALINAEFDRIKRVKTMGFISILEREYHVDLGKFREEAAFYYDQHQKNESITLGVPMPVDEKRGKSKLFMFIVLLLIIYAIWYAFTHLDKEKLSAMLPFSEETLSRIITSDENSSIAASKDVSSLSIESVQHKNEALDAETSEENRSH